MWSTQSSQKVLSYTAFLQTILHDSFTVCIPSLCLMNNYSAHWPLTVTCQNKDHQPRLLLHPNCANEQDLILNALKDFITYFQCFLPAACGMVNGMGCNLVVVLVRPLGTFSFWLTLNLRKKIQPQPLHQALKLSRGWR